MAALSLSFFTITAAASPAASRCQTGRGTAIRAGAFTADEFGEIYRAGRGVYACRFGHRSLYIGGYLPPGPAYSTVKVAISGEFAAAASVTADPPEGGSAIIVADLATRRIIAKPRPASEHSSDVQVLDLVMNGRAIAWTVALLVRNPSTGVVSTTYEVHRRDRSGAALLDSGPGIAGDSLAVSPGGTLYWTDAGAARSARI